MRKDKETILALRREGKSYREIMELVPISKSTLCAWFRPHPDLELIKQCKIEGASLANSERMQKMQAATALKWKNYYDLAKDEARVEFKENRSEELFIAGVCLYWGEGDKNIKCPIRIANTEAPVVRIFAHFMQRYGGARQENLHVSLVLYPDLDQEECEAYWSRELSIDRMRFHKSQIIQGRHKTKRLAYGVGTVVLSNSYVKIKILEWIRLLGEEYPVLLRV